MGNGPPTYRPSVVRRSSPPRHYPKNLDRCFAADPFDPRFVRNTPGRELTPLGALVNSWWFYIQNRQSVGPAFAPIAGTLEAVMRRECPDTLEFLNERL